MAKKTPASAPEDRPGTSSAAGVDTGTAAKLAAPVAMIVAGWGVPRILNSTYRRATGNSAPRASDPSIAMRKVVLGAAVTAAAVAAVNVVIERFATRMAPPS